MSWTDICAVTDIIPGTGVCALLGQHQVAVFRPYADEQQKLRFRHFINSAQPDPLVQFVSERHQHRPAKPEERIPTYNISLEEPV